MQLEVMLPVTVLTTTVCIKVLIRLDGTGFLDLKRIAISNGRGRISLFPKVAALDLVRRVSATVCMLLGLFLGCVRQNFNVVELSCSRKCWKGEAAF